MKKNNSILFARFFILFFGLAFFFSGVSRANEPLTYKIPFFNDDASIVFHSETSPDGEEIRVYLTDITATGSVVVDLYETEGGVAPEIKSVFVSGKTPKRLFVIVAWAADNPSIGTGGSIYQVFVYDERIEKDGAVLRLHRDTALTNRFGVGFDGIREGESLAYKYKNSSAIKRQLREWGYK